MPSDGNLFYLLKFWVAVLPAELWAEKLLNLLILVNNLCCFYFMLTPLVRGVVSWREAWTCSTVGKLLLMKLPLTFVWHVTEGYFLITRCSVLFSETTNDSSKLISAFNIHCLDLFFIIWIGYFLIFIGLASISVTYSSSLEHLPSIFASFLARSIIFKFFYVYFLIPLNVHLS